MVFIRKTTNVPQAVTFLQCFASTVFGKHSSWNSVDEALSIAQRRAGAFRHHVDSGGRFPELGLTWLPPPW